VEGRQLREVSSVYLGGIGTIELSVRIRNGRFMFEALTFIFGISMTVAVEDHASLY
jgi:hypothetical protein